MAIIPRISLFSWKDIEDLGDLKRLKLVIEHLPDEELMITLEKQKMEEMIILFALFGT